MQKGNDEFELEDNTVKTKLFSPKLTRESFVEKLNESYDDTINMVIDKALLSIGRNQNKDGYFQVASFVFISSIWTIVNGWYAYSVVFTGYLIPLSYQKIYFQFNLSLT